MTRNQIAYHQMRESIRHNKQTEGQERQKHYENVRHNTTTEVETNRSNVAREAETKRSNKAQERIAKNQLKEQQRHNKHSEAAGYISSVGSLAKGLGAGNIITKLVPSVGKEIIKTIQVPF